MHPQTLEGVWALDPKSRTGPFPWGVLRLSPLRALVRMMPARRPEVAGLDPSIGLAAGPGLPSAFISALRSRNVGPPRRVNTRVERRHISPPWWRVRSRGALTLPGTCPGCHNGPG